MSDLISIIIPAYNAGKNINRTLNSVCNQTYKNIEIIIVDDGSTDDTLNKCYACAKLDNRIKVYHKDNEGVTKARAYGVNLSIGKYIGFIDSDDEIDLDMIKILYNNMIEYGTDISHCGYKITTDNVKFDYYYNTGELIVQDKVTGLIDLITGDRVEPSLCNKLYKKSLFKNIDCNLPIRINEDYILNLYLFSNSHKSVFLDKSLYTYFQNSDSGSTQTTKEYFYSDILKAADIAEETFRENKDIYPYVQRRWFKTYSDMYKNQSSYDFKNAEFNLKSKLKNVRKAILEKYKYLKQNKLLNFSDKFILYTIKYCPKLLLLVCKLR